MAKIGYKDVHGADVGDYYISKDQFVQNFPNLAPAAIAPELFSWGISDLGQVGDGTTTSRSTPVRTVANTNAWRVLSTGTVHRGAITDGGVLWCWGRNSNGQLGDGTTVNKSSPVTTAGGGTNWKTYCAAKDGTTTATSVGIKTDGTLWTWGAGSSGRLGDGTTVDKSSPITTAGGGTNWKQAGIGGPFIAAVKTDGTLWTWGSNVSGQLGDGSTTNRSSPGTTAGGGTDWKTVSVGGSTVAAIKIDGTIYTWGSNTNGILGDGTTTNRSSPVSIVGGITNWKSVCCGTDSIAAIREDGTLWTWGTNTVGQLGDGTTTNRSSPGTTAGGGTTWAKVSLLNRITTTEVYATAIKTNGSLWTWGTDAFTSTNISSPVSTSIGGNAWVLVDGTMALKQIDDWLWSSYGYN